MQERPCSTAEVLDVRGAIRWSGIGIGCSGYCRGRSGPSNNDLLGFGRAWWLPVPESRADLTRLPIWPNNHPRRQRVALRGVGSRRIWATHMVVCAE